MALLLKGVVKAIALKHDSSAVNEFRRRDEDDLYRVATLKRGLEAKRIV